MIEHVIKLIFKNSKKNKSKGFTLVELLIVISIMGILSGITLRVINPTELNKKSRDSQRIVDAKKLQTALELYFLDFRRYPAVANSVKITGEDELSTTLVQNGYIDVIPTDPRDIPYQYSSENGSNYVIVIPQEFVIENECSESPYNEQEYGCKQFSSPF